VYGFERPASEIRRRVSGCPKVTWPIRTRGDGGYRRDVGYADRWRLDDRRRHEVRTKGHQPTRFEQSSMEFDP
jgi:hypothetical protein